MLFFLKKIPPIFIILNAKYSILSPIDKEMFFKNLKLYNPLQFALFFLFLISVQKKYAQKPIYKHFGVDEGLPSSQIYDIHQTKDGYIWFATDKGLSRYNGYEFENFDTSDGLPGNVVLRFYPQENGEIWAYTFHNKALFYFNENFKGFKNYKHNEKLLTEFHNSATVKSVYIDSSKTVNIGGYLINGVLSISEKGIVKKQYNSENYFDRITKEYMVFNNISENGKNFFLTTNKAIAQKSFSLEFSPKGSSHLDVTWLKKNRSLVFRNGNVISILDTNKEKINIETPYLAIGSNAIDSSKFFVGYYNKGGSILNSKGKVVKEFLDGKSVTAFLIDHSGGYWFSTLNSGAYYIKNPSISIYKTPNIKAPFHVNSLAKKNKSLLIGYKNGSFAKINESKSFEYEKAISNSSPSFVEYDVFRDKTYIHKNNKLYINNEVYEEGSSLKLSEPILSTPIFSSNRSSFSEAGTEKLHEFYKRVQDVSIFKKDTLIATPFGIYQKLKDSVIDLSKEFSFLGYRSDDIDVSNNGDYFFIATHGAGVVFYGKKKFNITVKDGLTSNIVKEIYIENDSTILASTNKGLNRIIYNDNGYNIKTINKKDGLLSNEIEDIEIINDTLWIGSRDGLCYMPKSIFNQKITDSIYLKIKEIKVNEIVYNINKSPILNYNDNKITFLVQAISFANNYDLKYEYRLKEIDDNWNSTKNRKISFPSLEDGKYTFQVRACIGSKCYEENKLEYKFIINPPFWRSWWFRVLCILVFSALFYVFFKIRVLTYNKDIIREFIRLLIKSLKRNEKYLEIRMNGESIKVITKEILFIKSSGNYLDIITTGKTYTIRCKIGNFIDTTPDALEYLRVHRSFIIRIDKVTSKSKRTVTIKKTHVIPVGETYLSELNKIHF